ncbi:hypothetical protein [Planktosalinus lacus]|uniref:Uncharacterized protein n=1 Tax=Planktosalinus lacus TaxID=1526573 RepID=A0A8J2VB47_9FLAO|nr:hypothetical protein [Planktosalinus lacus]GGD97470.1 hypothetical protein GCM10011312_21320 [Planktosalinus lacus]
MKNILFFLLPLYTFGQVGIHTSNPESTLHVAGENSNVKVEGLNAINNPNNLGSESTSRVYVDANGDLVLGDRDDNLRFIMDNEDYIPNNREQKVVQTGTGDNFTYLVPNNHTFPSFTLTDDAVIEINYSLSWRIERNIPQKISDNGARTVKSTIFIYDHATSTYLPTTYALTAQFYSNGDSSKGADRFFYSTGSDYVSLPPGTYTVHFGGLVAGFGNDNIFAYFGADKDQLQILAYY